MRPIGLLGGTFDPIHRGHIELACEAYQQLRLEHVRFIPVNIPPHRQMPTTSADHRRMMVELVIDNYDFLKLDDRELNCNEISYSVNTLESLREEVTDTPMCLLMGADAFQSIDSWHRWQELPDLAHVVIAQRPGITTKWNENINKMIDSRTATDAAELSAIPAGLFFFMDFPPVDISATAIRHALATEGPTNNWLHESTLDYIQQHDLYQDAA